ncbi:hypothetical protein O181_033067 [Austropuccinia psidii MF-1]|uniref:Uncharacterized protein n=1 Tax=Austropuccinia psidii MF-1 TaxID=1389203 RepID=A0A9Q3D3V7_9BASI|nr:hypothetical protein [Austropuccinia psidii MF-1]
MWQGGLMLEGPFPLVRDKFIPVQSSSFQGSIPIVCDEFDGEAFEVVDPSIGHQSSTSPSQPPFKRSQSEIIPSTPRNFQQVLSRITSSIPSPSPNPSTARLSPTSPLRKSPIPQPRKYLMVTSQKLQPVESSSR